MNLKYVLIGLVRKHAPESVFYAVMKMRGEGNGAEIAPDLYFGEWQKQLAKHGVTVADKHVLELGSGRYARLGLRLLGAGARRVTLVDFYATPLRTPSHYTMLARDCAALGLDIEDALSRIEVIRGDITTLPPPSPNRQVDLVSSRAVLEHVRDPRLVLECCRNWLRPGGVTYHWIDMRDHNLQFQYPFEMLAYSNKVWERWFDLRGGFHVNRCRLPDYLRAIEDAGFIHVKHEVDMQDKQGLQEILPRIDKRFRSLSKEVLSTLAIYLYGEKPYDIDQLT